MPSPTPVEGSVTTAPPAPRSGPWARFRAGVAQGLIDSGLEQLALRWRFRLVVLAFAVPFLGYIVWASTQQAALEKKHIHAAASAQAALLAARFEDHIEQIDRLLATAAYAMGRNINDVAAIDSLLQNMHSFVPRSVDNLGVWGLDGRIIVALDRRAATRGVNIQDRTYFKQAIATRDFVFQGPIQSRLTNAPILQFARPVFDANNEVVAVLTMSMRPIGLIELLDQTGVAGYSGAATIINRDGIVVARSVNADYWVGKPAPSHDGLAEMFRQRSGIRDDFGFDGAPSLTGYAVVGKWPWVVTVDEPVNQVLGPIGTRLLRNLGIGLVILALAFMIAGRVADWTTKPLMQLAVDAELFGRGELSHRSAVVTGGEIATVASNFNRMATALENREIALAASRTQLRAIADNIPEQISYVDPEYRYRFVNAQFADPEAVIGKTVREARGDGMYEAILPRLEKAMAGQTQSDEISIEVDGRLSHYFVNLIPDFAADRSVQGVYSFLQDITERKTAELLRMESEKRLVTITDNLPALIAYVDGQRIFRFANRAYEKWFDRPLDEIIGQPFDRMMSPELASQYNYYFLRGMQGEACEYEVRIPLAQGRFRWLKCDFIPDVDEATGAVRGVYGMIHNVTKAKESEQRLMRLAQFDSLTGIANRHQFNETLARSLAENVDNPRPLALMFLDIDHFKQVNDRHGHACGDLLLKDFAARLVESVRLTDAVARLAGDEFVVLLEGMHSDEEPQFIARKIIAAVEKPFVLDDHQISITTSIGIAMRADRFETASVLMKRADEALYEAKRSGRNTFRMAG
jgi:diguanylate cyclase (GGDEF)-like protein/PAS domain S-box-containing protein